MGVSYLPAGPGFSITPLQIAFGTVLTGLIPPYQGPGGGAPFLYQVTAGRPNWYDQPYTRITSMVYTTAGTAHTLTVLRPLNWTYFPSGLPKNTTVIPNSVVTGIAHDPGLYTTSYNYPLPGDATAPARPANAAVSSTNKFVCYQLADGSWLLDTFASGTFGSTLTLTTGTPNTAYGKIVPGGPLFYFGATTLSDPRTGLAHQSFLTIASATKAEQVPAAGGGHGIPSLNPGDPMIVHSSNATATGLFDFVSGLYVDY